MTNKDKNIEMQQKYADNAKQYLLTHKCLGPECDCTALRAKYGWFPEETEV